MSIQTNKYILFIRIIVIIIITLTVFIIGFLINGNKDNKNISDTVINIANNANITFISPSTSKTIFDSSAPERNCSLPFCYLENEDNGIFCRSKGNPQCWMPPICFHSSSMCLMYISSGGFGDVCAHMHTRLNTTTGTTTYTCQYTYRPPTPIPTTYIEGNDAYNNLSKESFKSPTTVVSKTTQTNPTIIATVEPTLAPTGNCSIPMCYYDKPGTFARKKGNPKCWAPPTCFHSTYACLMYITSGGIGDHCASNKAVVNTTDNSVHYTCQYTYKPPTPRPTLPPTPKVILNFIDFNL